MTDSIRALLVDDEPLARRRLRALLRDEANVEIVGECADGATAVGEIEALEPDLVFLDVQMPEADGFAVLEALDPADRPVVVFVTAYDAYALKAFEVHALDYLLKPFSRARFQAALAHAREEVGHRRARGRQNRDSLDGLLRSLREAGSRSRRLVVRDGGRVAFVRTEEIDWIESAGNYVRIHVGPESHLLRGTIKAAADRLDPDGFVRISRSTIVNLERVREVHPWSRGDSIVVLRDGTQLPATGGFGRLLRERLKPGL